MTTGLRLRGTVRDLAALDALASEAPALVSRAWTVIDEDGASSLALSGGLDAALAARLAARGAEMVSVTPLGPTWRIETLGAMATVNERAALASRTVASLIEAVRPVVVPGDPVVEEACFVTSPDGPGAQATLERLLRLGRDDAQVATFTRRDGAAVVAIVVARPPAYLLMRARDEPGEGVRAFARVAADVWVEWGCVHPLAHLAQPRLAAQRMSAWIDRTGAWHLASAAWSLRPMHDHLAPRFDARAVDLTPSSLVHRFEIRLRMDAAPASAPELWLLSVAQFMALEALLDASTPDERARFRVARLDAGRGDACYLLREIARPGVARTGARVDDLLGTRGFVRAATTDNLYLPVGRRLIPAMRRDELRTLLALDRAQFVVVDEDANGPRIVSIAHVDEVPLDDLVDLVATDHRALLDRMIEASVFDLPDFVVEPPEPLPPPDTLESVEPGTHTHAVRIETASTPDPEPIAREPEPGPVVHDGLADVRRNARALEQRLARGGCSDAATWRELAMLERQLGASDEVCACLEAALFFEGALDPALTAVLRDERARRVPGLRMEDSLARDTLTPHEAAWLGADVLDRLASGTLGDEAMPRVVRRFADPALPISRRLAWCVLATCHRRTDDPLGITRAKESLLGAMNDHGVSETLDLPPFVRFSAPESSAPVRDDGARSTQLAALDDLWWQHAKAFVPGTTEPSRVLACFVRVTFAVGFMRLGAVNPARELLAQVEIEAPSHREPNRVLFQLYAARARVAADRDGADAWEIEAAGVLAAVQDTRVRDRVEWLRRGSRWLPTRIVEAPPPRPGQTVEDLLRAAEADPLRAATTLADVLAMPRRPYDYELNAAIGRTLAAALRTGRDATIAATLQLARTAAPSIAIPAQRARAIGACLRAAATLGDADAVDALLNEVIALVRAPEVPSVRDLVRAVEPGLAALRRLGAGPAAARLLDALSSMPRPPERERIVLRAALADGYLQLGDTARAEGLLDEALEASLGDTVEYVPRFEGASAVLAALMHWPTAERAARCARLLDGLDHFRDSFTANAFYETHKVLLLERLVDALSDEATLRSDRLQSCLDAEEQAIRRRIIADWRDACGR